MLHRTTFTLGHHKLANSFADHILAQGGYCEITALVCGQTTVLVESEESIDKDRLDAVIEDWIEAEWRTPTLDRITLSEWAAQYYLKEHGTEFLMELGIAVPKVWKRRFDRIPNGYSVTFFLSVNDTAYHCQFIQTEDGNVLNREVCFTLWIKEGGKPYTFNMPWEEAVEMLFDLAK